MTTNNYQHPLIDSKGGKYLVIITEEKQYFDEFGDMDRNGDIEKTVYHVYTEYEFQGMGGAQDTPDWEDYFETHEQAAGFANSVWQEIQEEINS